MHVEDVKIACMLPLLHPLKPNSSTGALKDLVTLKDPRATESRSCLPAQRPPSCPSQLVDADVHMHQVLRPLSKPGSLDML